MTAEAFVDLLEQPRATKRGYIACCPSHNDRHPSLSITEGDRGLLLKCWAGCPIEEIVAVMGLRVKDLFYDIGLAKAEHRATLKQRQAEHVKKEQAYKVQGLALDLFREADGLVQTAHKIDISQWSDKDLDERLSDLADAYSILEKEKHVRV
jgi:hypothetical protein